jgi:thiazole biosynthesis adenylyltransferase ThiF
MSQSANPELNNNDYQRYSRHLLLSEIGVEGQKRLKSSSVLLIGAGGLGSPIALYLAAAGVGRIGIVDMDIVDLSNLQRQIIHREEDVGEKKTESAKRAIHALNPSIDVELYTEALDSTNAKQIAASYDVVIDGTDNFPTRYLVNDLCVLLGKPLIYGSILKFEGQASVLCAQGGPCYRCLYPEPPPNGLVPNCAEGGVVGVLPGMIGTIQANEALKLILGVGEPLTNRLLSLDALAMRFREFEIQRDPNCPICSDTPVIKDLIDYQQFCGIATPVDEGEPVPEMTCEELAEMLDGPSAFLLDVRTPEECAICRIEGAINIPIAQLDDRIGEVPQDREIIVYCKSGIRSRQAVTTLAKHGLSGIALKGGIVEWANTVDDEMAVY